MTEPASAGALLDLLFVNREGLVGNVTVGGLLGHSDHEMIVFDSRRSKEGAWQNATLDFEGQTSSCLGGWLTESLWRQFRRAKESRNAGHSSRGKS